MKVVFAKSRREWRDWLSENHDKESEIWLIKYHKASGKASVSYDDSVEEALCFGWIDSVQKKFESDSSIQRFSPRKPKSNWSESNRIRARRLIEQNLMTSAGRKTLPEDL